MRVARCGSRASCPCSRRVARSDRTKTPTEKNEMDLPRQYRASEALERFLGDPEHPANVMSFHNVMQWDEQAAFPQAAVDELYRFGMNHHYVPVEYGGCFASYEEFQSLARVAARRDLTTAITFSTLIWSTLIWVGGTEQQKRHFAKLLRWAKEAPTLAYSEEQHGADLIANDLRAVKTEGGWRLTGEKWPINRATRSGVMAVLAKTGEGRDSRSLTLYMVEKRDLDPAHYANLPRVKTLGLRGCDISGVRFDDCVVPEHSRLGEVGEGLELALRAFQVTRSLCAGLSLGAVDAALRTTLSFAMNRRLYGGSVFGGGEVFRADHPGTLHGATHVRAGCAPFPARALSARHLSEDAARRRRGEPVRRQHAGLPARARPATAPPREDPPPRRWRVRRLRCSARDRVRPRRDAAALRRPPARSLQPRARRRDTGIRRCRRHAA